MPVSRKKLLSISGFIIKLSVIAALGFMIIIKLSSVLLEGIGKEFISFTIIAIIAILFIIVCLIFTEIFKFVNTGMVGELRNYNSKTIFLLLFKCFTIILSGFTLAILYKFGLSPNVEISDLDTLFYTADALLVTYSLIGVIKSEQLRELNFHKLETENQLLKSKINPHFLYNTLNNIDSLIWIDQEKASDSIIKLSSLMRYMTYQTQKPYVLLKDEIVHINDYIDLQKMRYDNPSSIKLNVDIKDEDIIYISPMLLIPFVENGFKHSDDKISDNAIIIDIKADKNKLMFFMDNSYKDNPDKTKNGGFGLNGVERRLKLIYKNNYDLKIEKTETRFRVSLSLRFRNDY